jgi:hypothetical protein
VWRHRRSLCKSYPPATGILSSYMRDVKLKKAVDVSSEVEAR